MNSGMPLKSKPLFSFSGVLSPSQRFGTKILAPFVSGVVSGPIVNGCILSGGGDWLTTRPGGVSELDVRLSIETSDKELVFMSGLGRRVIASSLTERLVSFDDWAALDPASYYLRLLPVFETGSSKYGFLNQIVSVGVGRFTSDGVAFDVHEIL